MWGLIPQVSIGACVVLAMKRVLLSVTEELFDTLEKERKRRMLDSIPETVRMIISEYFAPKKEKNP